MLHIILMILKILGILLLILLGIVLAVILAVLFVPVCYSAQGEKTEDRLSGKVKVSWLLSLLTVRLLYAGDGPDMEIFVLGIPLMKIKRKLTARQKKRPPRVKKPAEEKTAKAQKAAKKDSVTAKPEKKMKPEGEDGSRRISAGENPVPKEAVSPKEDAGKLEQIRTRIKAFFRAFFQIPLKIKEKFRKIRLTFKGFCDKIKQWRTFFKMDTTRRAWKFIKGEGKLLFKHILPRRIRGRLRFGFDDPSLTGQLLAAAGMFYPFYKERFTLIPVFDEPVLEGEIKIKGRIFGGYLLWQAWKIFRNRDVKITYQRFQHKEA